MLPHNPSTVYLDSCVLIRGFTKDEGYQIVENVLRLADASKFTLLISSLTLVEVRGQKTAEAFDEQRESDILRYLDHPRFLPVEFDRGVALVARRCAMQYRLKNPDAIHLASAIVGAADVFMTFDTGFPLDQEIEGVWVCKPYEPGADPIPGL